MKSRLLKKRKQPWLYLVSLHSLLRALGEAQILLEDQGEQEQTPEQPWTAMGPPQLEQVQLYWDTLLIEQGSQQQKGEKKKKNKNHCKLIPESEIRRDHIP